MTEKTTLQQIQTLAYGAINADDDQESFSNLMEIIKLTESDHQPAFAVGEYYSFTTYRKDYDADTNFIFKVLEIKNCGIRVCEYDCHGKNYEEYVYDSDSEFLKGSKPATAEQVAEFKRAEHFASKGRKLDEFRDRDIVKYEGELFFAKTTSESNLISVSGFDGYGWDDMNADEFDLIQTAEELQEVTEQ